MVQTVLLVEDDPQIARALTRMLRKGLSVEVVHVESNRDAIAFLATTTPSLVIMDLARPEGRGEDLVEYSAKTHASDRFRSSSSADNSSEDSSNAFSSTASTGHFPNP